MRLPSGHRLVHVGRIDSTNAEARRRAAAGERGPLWIWADEQTDGRGRRGRSWVSEPGNLYATFLFPLPAKMETAPQLALVAALAVHDAIVDLRPALEAAIKWPNDILIGGAKVSGILAEIVHVDPPVVAIGCGINVARAPSGLPYPATALGSGVEPGALLAALDRALSQRLALWDGGAGFDRLSAHWRERALGIGRPCRVSVMNGEVRGIFRDVAPDGAMVVERPDGSRTLIRAGDVEFDMSGITA